jgi:hypothetical protein
MKRLTPVACSLRVAASPLKGATPCAPAKPVARRFWTGMLAVAAGCFLVACSSTPPAPEWQMNAKGAAERATQAWLRGDARIEAAEFARVRSALASTGQPALLARAELLRCATRVASLVFEPCAAFEALAQDAGPAEQAYARYLAGHATPADAALLPAPHRALVGGTGVAPEAAVNAIADPLSQLVAAGVLLRSGRASDAVAARAADTASTQGWRRALQAWLSVQLQRAQAAGRADEAARLQRRIDLVR